MISELGFRKMASLLAEILSEALIMFGCMVEKMLGLTMRPCQEADSDEDVNENEDALQVWKTGG
jgi:hypothetical protein